MVDVGRELAPRRHLRGVRKRTALAFTLLLLFGCRWPVKEAVQGPSPLTLALPAWAIADTALRINIPYDNPMTAEGVALGRRLFHDPALSADGSLACSSCHVQRYAFSDTVTFSRGMAGRTGARNTMPLMNLAWDHFFFWDARALSVELQAFEPVTGHREMGNDWRTVTDRLSSDSLYPAMFRAAFGDARIDSLRVAFALAQFERTLISLNSRYDRFHKNGDTSAMNVQEKRGESLFFGRAHCVDCHEPPLFKDHHVVNIGLPRGTGDDGMGARTGIAWHKGRFKTPTLRNIAVTAPYMHDGRFATLEEVVDFYADGVNVEDPTLDEHMMPWVRGEVRLSEQDRSDLVAFLRTLTDEGFLANPEFGPPSKR